MKVEFAISYIVDPNVQVIYGETENDETISVGDTVSLPSKWGDSVSAKVYQLIPNRMEEYIPEEVGPNQRIEFLTKNINTKKIKTEIDVNKELRCITPYREIRGGALSIYDYVNPDFKVPEKVIKYLKTTNPTRMSPGIYQHPFKPGHRYNQGTKWMEDSEIYDTVPRLLGPYWYGDGKYEWDRDTWKYVVKYGLTLPQEFIDHVMSNEGTKFLEQFEKDNPSWSKNIAHMKQQKNMICMLPENAGDVNLEDF